MERKMYTAKILDKKMLTNDVVNIKIEKPEGFGYKAGQFVQFHLPDPDKQDHQLLRAYSICSIPDDETLEFCIKFVENGRASNFFKASNIGDTLTFDGPTGMFSLNDEITAPLHFIATGVGLAPIIGLIRDALTVKKTLQPVTLIFGLRSETDIFWAEQMNDLKTHYKNFKYDITLSQPNDSWNGLRERVTKHLPKEIQNDAEFFICGKIEMINDAKKVLVDNGADPKKVHFEVL